jgi:hypothetical protein
MGQVLDSGGSGRLSCTDFCSAIKNLVIINHIFAISLDIYVPE